MAIDGGGSRGAREGLKAGPRAIRETKSYLAWRHARMQENARRKAQNEIT